MTRRYDPRRALPHLSYTRAELAERFDVNIGTISSWMAKGLRTIDGRRPYVFAGGAVREFLKQHNKPYQPTGPGEIYCVACKCVIEPAAGVVTFVPLGPTNGNLVGTCPHCFHGVRQRVRKGDIRRKAGNLKVRFEDVATTVSSEAGPSRTQSSEESVS
jgi:hypothetical protein